MTPHLFGKSLASLERELILQTLERCRGNRTRAAKQLRVSIRTLRNKLKRYAGQGCSIPPHRSGPLDQSP